MLKIFLLIIQSLWPYIKKALLEDSTLELGTSKRNTVYVVLLYAHYVYNSVMVARSYCIYEFS